MGRIRNHEMGLILGLLSGFWAFDSKDYHLASLGSSKICGKLKTIHLKV